jgi:hypothetical protein
VLGRVDRARLAAVESASRQHDAQVAPRLVVDERGRELSIAQTVEEGAREEVVVVGPVARAHLEIQAIEGGLTRVVGAVPVGHDQALKAPLALEHLVEQIVVVAAVLSAELVVGAHHRQHARLLYGRLEGGQVDLAQRALVHLDVDRAALDLLVVRGEVLDARGDLLRLHAADVAHGEPGRQVGVLAQVLESAAAQRRAQDIDAWPQQDVLAALARLAA